VMPEHFHLLISEPEKDDPSLVMKGGQAGIRPRGAWSRPVCRPVRD